MDTRSEIIFDLDMSKEEQDMWAYCYKNLRTASTIITWKKEILRDCKEGLLARGEYGVRVSLPAHYYITVMGALLYECQYSRDPIPIESIDKVVLAIMQLIGSQIQEELFSTFGDTYMDVDLAGNKIIFDMIRMSDYRRYMERLRDYVQGKGT